MKEKKSRLSLPINHEYIYKLSDRKEGEPFPIVSDVMFHTMLNNESRKQYVSYFLSLLIGKDRKEIEENIIFVKNKLDKKNYHDSSKTVDFVCEIEEEIYNIEMNNNISIESLERNISYINDLYKSKMKRGSEYQYQKSIQINLNNFSFEGDHNTIEVYQLRDEEGISLTDKITIIYIYLPKIRKKLYNGDKLTELERLLLVFNEGSPDRLENLIGEDEVMSEYRKDALEASDDEEIIGLYDKELHLEMLRNTELHHAKEEGLEEGIEKGRREGIFDTVRSLLKSGVDKKIIMEATNLTEEEIKNISESN